MQNRTIAIHRHWTSHKPFIRIVREGLFWFFIRLLDSGLLSFDKNVNM
jgi:hypothetical protein